MLPNLKEWLRNIGITLPESNSVIIDASLSSVFVFIFYDPHGHGNLTLYTTPSVTERRVQYISV